MFSLYLIVIEVVHTILIFLFEFRNTDLVKLTYNTYVIPSFLYKLTLFNCNKKNV